MRESNQVIGENINRRLLDFPVKTVFLRLTALFLLLAECSFFFLSFVPTIFLSANNYQSKYLTSLVAVVGVLVVLVLSARDKTRRRYAFALPILAFVIMCFLAALMSAGHYHSTVGAVMSSAHAVIFVPLLYFVFHDYVYDERSYSFVINATIVFACIYAIFCFMQASGLSLMNSDFQGLDTRNGRTRIFMSGDFIAFGAVLALGCAFKTTRNRWLYIVAFLFLLLELYWVAQTRFIFVGLAFSALVGFIIIGKNRTAKVVLVFVVSLFTVVLYSDAIYSALFPQDLSFSTEARLLAYRYFPTHAGDMGAFGIGFIPNGSPYAVLINVDLTTGRGGVDDIGIVEYYARFGLMGVFVLIFAVASFVAEFRRSPKNLCVFEESAEAWMALAYFLALAPTMAITDPQRIFYLPYIVLMVEHTLVAKSIR